MWWRRAIGLGLSVPLSLSALGLVGVALAVSAEPLPARGTQTITLDCSDSVYGALSPSALSPAPGAVAAGPVAWPELQRFGSSIPPAHFSWPGGLGLAVKALAVVRVGEVVRVAIPPSERQRLALYYVRADPRKHTAVGDLYRVADGERQVNFRACSQGSGTSDGTQFPGYFIVEGAQCALIDVYPAATSRPLKRQIPFGVPERSCPANA